LRKHRNAIVRLDPKVGVSWTREGGRGEGGGGRGERGRCGREGEVYICCGEIVIVSGSEKEERKITGDYNKRMYASQTKRGEKRREKGSRGDERRSKREARSLTG
jgi:hypothetical protein